MDSSRVCRIVRFIALVDGVWSYVQLVGTILLFFGGEAFNGLFFQVEQNAEHLGPERVTGKKALTGLLFFLCLLIDLLWIFAALMLFKGTETKDCPSGADTRARLVRCKIWLYTSILLLVVEVVNMVIYITDSLFEILLANTAFLVRGLFMYFVQKYIRLLQAEDPSALQPVQVLYAQRNSEEGEDPPPPPPRHHQPPPCDNSGAEGISSNNNNNNNRTSSLNHISESSHRPAHSMVATIISADGQHRILINHEPDHDFNPGRPFKRAQQQGQGQGGNSTSGDPNPGEQQQQQLCDTRINEVQENPRRSSPKEPLPTQVYLNNNSNNRVVPVGTAVIGRTLTRTQIIISDHSTPNNTNSDSSHAV